MPPPFYINLRPSVMGLLLLQLSRDCNITMHNLSGEGSPCCSLSTIDYDDAGFVRSFGFRLCTSLFSSSWPASTPTRCRLSHSQNHFNCFCHSLKPEFCHRTGWCIVCHWNPESKNVAAMGSLWPVFSLNSGLISSIDKYSVVLFAITPFIVVSAIQN